MQVLWYLHLIQSSFIKFSYYITIKCLQENISRSLYDVLTDKTKNDSITITTSGGGKYFPCPHHFITHTFRSVQEILDVFPFVSVLICPKEAFDIKGVEIPAWDPLHILYKVSLFWCYISLQ